jgi:hypothetical protein
MGGVDANTNTLSTVDVAHATENPAGDTLSAFQSTTSLVDPIAQTPRGLLAGTVVATDTMLYILGGATDWSYIPSNVVLMARFNPDGTLGQWVLGPPLPATLRGHGAFIRNGVVYVLGGLVTPTSRTDQVATSRIQADGTLGAWTLHDTWKLPRARSDFGVLVY